MIFFKYCIVLTILPFCSVFAENRIEMMAHLIRDLIKNEENESIFWMKNCWQKHDSLKFIESLHVSIKLIKNSLATNFTKFDGENNRNVRIFIDMKCSDSIDFLKDVNQTYLGHPFRWIIVDGQDFVYEKLNILPDSNVILANFNENRSVYQLKQGKVLKFETKSRFTQYFLYEHEF